MRDWLLGRIHGALRRDSADTSFVLWCDPTGDWLELLRAAARHDGFELWALPDESEFALRDRFIREPRRHRVVWVPRGRADLSWFRVFEPEASEIWEMPLAAALSEYGVDLPREEEEDVAPLLAASALEWFTEPRERWRDLTPTTAHSVLVNDRRVLTILAGAAGAFARLHEDDRFGVFARRAVEDFGLPEPAGLTEDAWRAAATARLLCTEAAALCPQAPPREGDFVIEAGRRRDAALKLLHLWMDSVELMGSFESVSVRGDSLVGLPHWARSLAEPPASKSSLAVESALFSTEAATLERFDNVEGLVAKLVERSPVYLDRASGFWARHALHRVGWSTLVALAECATVLDEQAGIENGWRRPADAIEWYASAGWRLDRVGQSLFEDQPDFPAELERVRARLRRGLSRRLDATGRAFSECLAGARDALSSLPTAGECACLELEAGKETTALIFLDACRLELGHRLADLLNQGEPLPRARVEFAVAPVPSITALGMAFALPMAREQLRVGATAETGFDVRAEGFDGNLVLAEQRRRWLASRLKVKTFVTMRSLLEGEMPKRSGRIMVVWGDDFDVQGHDGRLQFDGPRRVVEQYARAIRRLRDAGYGRVIVVTDHGFFHWRPEEDEVVDEKPEGEVLWQSRRAIVGRGLRHRTGVSIPVPCSDLEAVVPRSVNAFKTYGGLGFFHGGASLAELVVPVIVCTWPAKGRKIGVVLKPVAHVTSLAPRIQLAPTSDNGNMVLAADPTTLARRVWVKIVDPASGRTLFKHEEAITVEASGEGQTVQLQLVPSDDYPPFGSRLVVQVSDADDDLLLERQEVQLKVQMDDW